jgi:hypothetical protein
MSSPTPPDLPAGTRTAPARKIKLLVWILGGIGLLVCATLAVGFLALRAVKNAGFAFRFDPAKKTLVMIGGGGKEVKTSAADDQGHSRGGTEQKVLIAWLAQHPEYRAAVDADCACDELLRLNPGAHPYTATDQQADRKVCTSHFQRADRGRSGETSIIPRGFGSSAAGPVFRSVIRGAAAPVPWILQFRRFSALRSYKHLRSRRRSTRLTARRNLFSVEGHVKNGSRIGFAPAPNLTILETSAERGLRRSRTCGRFLETWNQPA